MAVVTIRMHQDLHRGLKELAHIRRKSMNTLLLGLVNDAVERSPKARKARDRYKQPSQGRTLAEVFAEEETADGDESGADLGSALAGRAGQD